MVAGLTSGVPDELAPLAVFLEEDLFYPFEGTRVC
jgi:hypothetical protein